MAITQVTDLVDILRQYRLLEPAQLEELSRDLLDRYPEPLALARELLQRDWLTAYQVNQLFQGNGQGLVLGSYVLLERLGEGGMGQVFKARHQKLDRLVALKVIRKECVASPAAVRRFHREVRAAGQLAHPNIVHALDADQIGDTHLLVMEYVEGLDLARHVKQHGPLPVAEACDYVGQVALGLQHSFEKGMVHRDIKPHNLLLSTPPSAPGRGTVRILDMGLARLGGAGMDSESSTLSHEGDVMGTPDYIAPEQALGAPNVDIRADLYSLGCTLYFLLTGRPPFPGGTLGAKLIQHQLDEPEPLERLRPEVPLGVVAVVRRLMAKQPADRYQTPAEAAVALAEAPSTVLPIAHPTANDSVDAARAFAYMASIDTLEDAVSPRQTQRAAVRRRWLLWNISGGGVLLALAAALVFLLTRPSPPSRPDPDGKDDPQPVPRSVRNDRPPAPVPVADPWRPLFNGKDLSGWKPGWNPDKVEGLFTVAHPDGVPVLRISGEGRGLLLRQDSDDFADYHLRLEFQWPPGTRDGEMEIAYHRGRTDFNLVRLKLRPGLSSWASCSAGRRFDLGEWRDGEFRITRPNTDRLLFPPNMAKPAGEWNRLELVCWQSTVVYVLNDRVMGVALNHRRVAEDQTMPVTGGMIGLASILGEVWHRRIEIRSITALPAELLR